MSAPPPCSDINLLGYRERIVDLDTKVSDGALHPCVAQEELYCPHIASAPVDQRGFGTPDRMCTKQRRIQANSGDPLREQAGVLAGREAALLSTAAGKKKISGRLTSCGSSKPDPANP